jgi:hypothetical protein
MEHAEGMMMTAKYAKHANRDTIKHPPDGVTLFAKLNKIEISGAVRCALRGGMGSSWVGGGNCYCWMKGVKACILRVAFRFNQKFTIT